jgi:diaminopimelate decarboxylase
MIKKINDGLMIEDVNIFELAEKYGTPLYCYSKQSIKDRIKLIYSAMEELNDFHLGFALKANNNIHLINLLVKNGCMIDIVNLNEYTLAREGGTSADKIVVNGNGKSREFLETMISEGVYSINIDSYEEYKVVRNIVEKIDNKENIPNFMLRVNPDVNPHTHPYISTGLKENKFGIQMDVARKILSTDKGLITGLHTHIGSNIYDISAFKDAFSKISELIKDFVQLKTLNIGGGWGIDYHKDGNDFAVETYKKEIVPVLRAMNCQIMMEIGRFILGPSGILLSKVLYKKMTEHKNFVVCDANMANMIRPALYDAYHHIQPLHTKQSQEKITADIVGGLCETGDRLGKNREIEDVNKGDLLAIHDAGAYGFSMASNYNAESKPAEVLIYKDSHRLIRKRETVKDLLKNMKI